MVVGVRSSESESDSELESESAFSARFDRIFKNYLCCIHYRFLMLYGIIFNFCI